MSLELIVSCMIICVFGCIIVYSVPMAFNFFIEAASILLVLLLFAILTAVSIGVTVALGFIGLISYALYIAYISIKRKFHFH